VEKKDKRREASPAEMELLYCPLGGRGGLKSLTNWGGKKAVSGFSLREGREKPEKGGGTRAPLNNF